VARWRGCTNVRDNHSCSVLAAVPRQPNWSKRVLRLYFDTKSGQNRKFDPSDAQNYVPQTQQAIPPTQKKESIPRTHGTRRNISQILCVHSDRGIWFFKNMCPRDRTKSNPYVHTGTRPREFGPGGSAMASARYTSLPRAPVGQVEPTYTSINHSSFKL